MSSIDRPAHKLKRGRTLNIPRQVVLFDTETSQTVLDDGSTVHRLKLGWACYYRRSETRRVETVRWLFFTDPAEFWAWLLPYAQGKQKLWLIAHNIGFDFTIVNGWEYLRAAEYKCRFFYASGLTTIISLRKPGSSLVLVDSLNWFPESLEQLGDRLDVPKIKIDFDTCSFSELKAYCKNDVLILLESFKSFAKFLIGNRISRLCYTIASTAMSAYLFGSYRHTIYIHNNAEAIALERKAYRGGRTECFFLGELNYGPYTFVDVNSLYPFVMHGHLYPVRYDRIGHGIDRQALAEIIKNQSVIAEVDIVTDQPVFALKRNRTIFPVGSFTVTLCTPELRYALEHGFIRSIGDYVVYDNAPIFTDYVDKFYSLRNDFKAADVPMYDHFCKKLLNTLYGKFGQRAENWEKIGEDKDHPDGVEEVFDAAGGPRRKLRYLLGDVFELTGWSETFNSFPAIAAHVTAYARLYLWELMQVVGEGHYYYCDTDSLVVDQAGLESLDEYLDDTKLGKLKIEYQTSSMTIYGAKDYVTDNKTVIKGIRRNAVNIAPGVYRQELWPSLQGMLRKGSSDTYTVKVITKHLERNYLKGIVLPDGWIVPLVLDGDVCLPI